MINDVHIDNGQRAAIPNSGCLVFTKREGVFELDTLKNYDAEGNFTGEALAQQIGITLRFWKGDWFLDADYGIPVAFQVGKPLEPYFVADITTELLKIPSVTRVRDVKVARVSPTLILSLTVEVDPLQILTVNTEV